MKLWILGVLIACAASSLFAGDTPATITSDELELQKNGEVTIFRGHVVLLQTPYEIRAQRMTRRKDSGHVEASGQVMGTWVSPKQERIRVQSDEAIYRPDAETVDLWGKTLVEVHLFGAKEEAHFRGERGWISTDTPGKARLSGKVTGHVIPG